MARALVILAEGFEEIEAATPIDVLRRAGVEVVVAGVGGTLIRGARGLTFQADALLSEVAEAAYDVVVLPGGMPGAANLGEAPAVAEVLAQVQASGGRIAAICAAPALVLGPLGYLRGKHATCYPSFADQLPPDAVPSEARVCVDQRLTTSRGPGTALDFALSLVAQLTSPDQAQALRFAMLA